MEKLILNTEKQYNLTKILEDGTHKLIMSGSIESDTIKVDECFYFYGRGFSWYRTSPVTGIERTGKGCLFETLNSTYLLEQVDEK